MEDPNENVVIPLKERLRLAEQRVIVVCKRFRCLGYVDEKGVWRDDSNSNELEDVVGWVGWLDFLT